jgi:hypothetical protein
MNGADRRPRVALLVEPRFPGGTGSAVADEIRALAPVADLAVHGLSTRMFGERPVNPLLAAALEDVGHPLLPVPPVVRADTVVLHNPACLKNDEALVPRLSAARVVVVTHENFLRPGGGESFDVGHCLGLLSGRLAGAERLLAPVSGPNRATVAAWLAARPRSGWRLADGDWPNLCAAPFLQPPEAPRDRRGRHSRPGLEKFPGADALRQMFPPHAERCAILGADLLLREREALPRHWELLPFGAMPVGAFLEGIDFFVYFTNPLWRESFGRAIAEAIAAGRLVVTDPATAEPFGPGVIAAEPAGVDAVVAAHIAEPARYAESVRQAQQHLTRHRPEAVVPRLMSILVPREVRLAAL